MTEQGSQQEKPNSLEDIKGKVANVSSEKRWAMSCYIPFINLFTCILTSVKMVNNKFCRFHARQGLMVFALWVVAIVIGIVFSTLGLMLWGIVLVLCVAGMVIAYGGKETSIPVLGQFAMKIPEYYIFKLLTGKIPEQDEVVGGVKEQAKPDSEKKETENKEVSENIDKK
ncbi:MAG: hypothetical protein WCX95_03515 [Candidatus Gracilibacteria bacterium]